MQKLRLASPPLLPPPAPETVVRLPRAERWGALFVLLVLFLALAI